MKHFKITSNLLVATRFQQLGKWSPFNRVAHSMQAIHTLRDKEVILQPRPLLHLLVTTNELEKLSLLS
jgi:hypothetical protein